MKKNSTTLLTQLGSEQVASLTTIVDETLAFGLNTASPKKFTAAELWNIQQQKKARVQRRFIF